MTTQEIFDTVVNHLFTQGRPAIDDSTGYCKYLSKSGLKCAVGCLIKPEHYHPEMEGGTMQSTLVRKAVASSVLPEVDLKTLELDYLHNTSKSVFHMLRRLQSLHDSPKHTHGDSVFDKTLLANDLRLIADDFSLSTSAIDAHCKPS
jgi:hypothetical protein